MDVTIDLKENSYVVSIEEGLFNSIGEKIVALDLNVKKVLIVTDSNVGPLYLNKIAEDIKRQGIEVAEITLPAGEIYKTVAAVELIWEKALESELDRQSMLVALGGGVISDLTGFAAATYLRGIKFITIPTTLLAQVDASVGGKTGFNLRSGKNLVGAFYQPKAVFIDSLSVRTLKEREYINGYAEIVKHALITDNNLLELLEENLDLVKTRDSSFLARLIHENVLIKASIVAADEKEKGLRAILNLGHTAGHALEEIGEYKSYYHGEAVAIGLVIACYIAKNRGLVSCDLVNRVSSLLSNIGLPIQPLSLIDAKLWWEKTSSDKKSQEGVVYWVLPNLVSNKEKRLGQAFFGQRVEFIEFQKALEESRELSPNL